jgi:twinkle protein
MADYIKTHIPCPDTVKCQSSDGASMNSDGSIFCFVCKNIFPHTGGPLPDPVTDANAQPRTAFGDAENIIITGQYKESKKRGIHLETAKLFKTVYGTEKTYYGYYSVTNPMQPVAVKMRLPGKVFPISGNWAQAGLFGQQNFSNGGKYLTICEGEEDAMAVHQMVGRGYAVVSVRNGAQAARTDCRNHFDWIRSFDQIRICFDNDEVGMAAAKEVASLFSGKARIVKHAPGMKDASDYCAAGAGADFTQRWWNAEQYVPDGIVSAGSLREALKTPVPPPTMMYPWHGLNKMTRGIREGELVVWCAGAGVGKSSLLREIVQHSLVTSDRKMGLAFLEETPERTMRGLVGLEMCKPIHFDGTVYTPAEVDQAYDRLGLDERVHLWDHFGSTGVDNVISRLLYFIKAMDCSFVILDHISIVVSGAATHNERQTLDELMTRLRTEIVQQTQCSLHVVSHLTRPDGKPLEHGAPTHLGLLRGSGSIAQLSDVVIGAERNSQADDIAERNTIKLRVLKSRLVGKTGVACSIMYNEHTGRLIEVGDLDND